MANELLEHRLRIRDATNSSDAVVVSSVRGDTITTTTGPYLESAPSGDGASFDPLTGQSLCASYTGRIVDSITSGTSRIMTAQLENGSGQQQLGYRVAFVELRVNGGSWVTLVAGYLVLLRLVDAITWEFTVQDASRAVGGLQAFGVNANMTIASVLAAYPTRGCLFGGPVTQDFLGLKTQSGWKMRVHRTGSSGSYSYYFEFLQGYGPPAWTTSSNLNDFVDAINAIADSLKSGPGSTNTGNMASFTTAGATVQQAVTGNDWPGLIYQVRLDGSSTWETYRPLAPLSFPGLIADPNNPYRLLASTKQITSVFGKNFTFKGAFAYQDGHSDLADGAIVFVRALTVGPTDASPIYIDDHPANILKVAWDQVGVPYYSTGITDLINALGADERLALRITAAQTLQSFLENTVIGLYGVGVRVGTIGVGGTNGLLVPFATRRLSPALPSVTITADDVVDGKVDLTFELDVTTGVNTVEYATKILTFVQAGQNSSAADAIDQSDGTLRILNPDPGTVPSGTASITVLGMPHAAGSWSATNPTWFAQASQTLFDRFGRGNVVANMLLLRGGAGDAVNLGDEVIIAIPQLPNHNKRLADDLSVPGRRMQLVRVTERPDGRLARFSDSGPNANQLATLPTLSLALTSDLPRTVATVTITNAATLNGLGYGVRIQVATTASGGPAPAATDYQDYAAWSSGAIPTTAQRIGPFVAGQVVYVRARSEKAATNPASNYSIASSITLSSVSDPTSVTSTPSGSDGSLATLAWTAGSGTSADLIDVFLRLSGQAFSLATRVETLVAGSTRYLLQGLTPGVAYIASVQYRDPRSENRSNVVDVSFTAGGTTRTLAAPVTPTGFACAFDSSGVPRRDGSYGIAVLAAEFPGLLEVAIAVETAIGSGTYGSFVTQLTPVASVQGDWTIFGAYAPNDGLNRKLKARHVADGATSSAYCADVVVLPWTPLALPPLSSLGTAIVIEVTMLAAPATGQVKFQVNGIDPAGGTVQVEIVSKSSTIGIASGPAVGTPAANGQQWTVSQPQTSSGPGTVLLRAFTVSSYTEQSLVIPEVSIIANPQMVVAIDANGNWQATADAPLNVIAWMYLTSTSAYPADATVLSSGTAASNRSFSISGGPLSLGQTVFITAIPFESSHGTPLPSVHGRGSYLTMTATKTANYGPGGWAERTNPPWGTYGDANLNVLGMGVTLTSNVLLLAMLPLVPSGTAGVTITSASVDVFSSGGVGGGIAIGVTFFRKTAGGAQSGLGSASGSIGGGWQTLTMSLSENTAGRGYLFDAQLQGASAGGALGVGNCTVTYTMTDSKQTL